LVPQGWLEKQAAGAIKAGGYGLRRASCARGNVDLRQIKDRLQGPAGLQVASDVVNAIPTCAANQQPHLSLTQLPECIPPVFDRDMVAEQVAATLSEAAAQMPGEYDIGPRLAPSTRFGLMSTVACGRRARHELLLLAVATLVGVLAALLGGAMTRLVMAYSCC
jgi:hypothetical protein